jgi:hypothetical protein
MKLLWCGYLAPRYVPHNTGNYCILIDILSYVHDLKPDRQLVLIDFGIVK